jgi:hypothetical protein
MLSPTNRRCIPCCLVLFLGSFSACDKPDDARNDQGETLVDAATRADGSAPSTARDAGVDVPESPSDASAGDAASAPTVPMLPPFNPGVTMPMTPGATPPTNPDAMFPAQILDLTNWKLNVPLDTDHPGNPDEYRNPELQTFDLPPYFTVTPNKDGVAFRAHAAGATTPNSKYPRSELREMMGSEHAAWSTTSGVHRMRVIQAITHVMPVKPEVVSAQIHDARDDVVMVRLEGNHLFVEGDGDELATLDDNYQLGTVFGVELVAQNGTIEVFYNGESKALIQRAVDGCYFKAGCYAQSNVQRGESPDAFAEVVIYDLEVTHE